jgi:hypothetical protein
MALRGHSFFTALKYIWLNDVESDRISNGKGLCGKLWYVRREMYLSF